MAAKSSFSKSDFVKILARYPLGEYRGSDQIAAGAVQTNILIRTTRGKFVFRYYENRSRKSALFEIELLRFLKSRRYPCSVPHKNNYGQYVGTFKAKPYVIFEFVNGKHVKRPNKIQKKQLIKKIAELHEITRNYKLVNLKSRLNYNTENCLRLARKEARKIGTANAQKKLDWLEGELSKLELPKSLPKGICHCDSHFSNTLFKKNKLVALIDFDDANYTFLIYDIAAFINPFVSVFDWNTWRNFRRNRRVFDFKEPRLVVSEYMRHRSLKVVEKKHLLDVFKLSILFDCIWYFKRGGAKDFYEKRKLEYLNALGRERFCREIFGKP